MSKKHLIAKARKNKVAQPLEGAHAWSSDGEFIPTEKMVLDWVSASDKAIKNANEDKEAEFV